MQEQEKRFGKQETQKAEPVGARANCTRLIESHPRAVALAHGAEMRGRLAEATTDTTRGSIW